MAGDTCAALTSKYGISTAQFLAWNKGAGSSCNIWLGYYVCVKAIGVTPSPTTTTSKMTTTTKGNGVTTPTPVQAGMVGTCKTFHWVVNGDTCASIAKAANISVANFVKWNPAVGSDCKTLWLETWACIALI
ncbi:uncharacterized protein B0I36DRAFT_363235 [Microdochium trichocladiopsis]|uniref:LysM domain-containing protein n=1 Tax=Microdochium trichocladiopsis TaxID=1682393 RepID=A0A9P9BNT2_9PEZI|nr:uncharacterized protein B0I36DRAFT_363235 [Microdochium trichocladiopsis]KAH7031561.1 hypothetical protein B0I36DRAFT_363235 [Microdochium trichocladiopsis]